MAFDQRIPGINPATASFFLRTMFAAARRIVQKIAGKAVIPGPLRVAAHQPGLVWGLGQMEMAQSRMKTVPAAWKTLASIRVSSLAGCPN